MRAIVFIDGNNFYFRLRDLLKEIDGKFSLLEFDYQPFSRWLVKPNQLIQIRYYIGALRRQKNNDKSEKLYADQQKLLAKLQNQKIEITLGQLIQHPDKTIHEKGVDVRLAVEMIRFAREDSYDIAYLLSSDTDLVAAIEEVKSFEKRFNMLVSPKDSPLASQKPRMTFAYYAQKILNHFFLNRFYETRYYRSLLGRNA